MKLTRGAALVVSVGLLAGCGGGGDKPAAVGTEQSPTGQRPSSSSPVTGGGGAAGGGDGGKASSTGEPSSSGSPGGSGSSSAPKASGGDAAKAEALTAAGLLVAGDLPGFAKENLAFDGSENFGEVALYQCLRISGPQYLSRTPGAKWTKGEEFVESTASVVAKAADLKRKVKASKEPYGPGCYVEGLQRLGPDQVTIVQQSSSAAAKVAKADDSFGVKFTLTWTKDGQTSKLSGYLVGAIVGTVEIFVLDAAMGAGPALADVVALTNAAAGRARAAQK